MRRLCGRGFDSRRLHQFRKPRGPPETGALLLFRPDGVDRAGRGKGLDFAEKGG